ncbi:MAG: hypothetical protein ABSC37_03115 [Xanthobacteraceae bacterium]|jgi:hypothetical protein
MTDAQTITNKIAKALCEMDEKDDSQWMADGTPKTAVVQQLAGDRSISRRAIAEAFPDFRRNVAIAEAEADAAPSIEQEPAPDDVADMVEMAAPSNVPETSGELHAFEAAPSHDPMADKPLRPDIQRPQADFLILDSRGRFIGADQEQLDAMPEGMRALYDQVAEFAAVSHEWEGELKAANIALTAAMKRQADASRIKEQIKPRLSATAAAREWIARQRSEA